MKEYKITGYIKPKGAENKDWQKIGESAGIRLPDDINPYEEIQKSFKLVSSNWLFTVDEVK